MLYHFLLAALIALETYAVGVIVSALWILISEILERSRSRKRGIHRLPIDRQELFLVSIGWPFLVYYHLKDGGV